MNKNQKQIIGVLIVIGFFLALILLLKGSKPSAPSVTDNKPVATDNGSPVHTLGNPDAPIVIVEYSDTECPFCRVFHNTMHQVVENSNGNVAWVFKHYPIPSLHPKAFLEAEATECAWEQGGNEAFWAYVDRLFAITPSNNGLEVAELTRIAEYIGLDVASFNTCLNSGKYTARVQADIDDGVKA